VATAETADQSTAAPAPTECRHCTAGATGRVPPPMKACLYLFDGWADWEPAFAVAGIAQPQFQRQPGRWQVVTAGPGRHALQRSMGGVAALPDLSLADLDPQPGDLLILPGGAGWEDSHAHDQAVAVAAGWLERGHAVAAICGATAGLARAGLLDRRAHTSNAASYLRGTGYAGAAHYREEPAVDDRGLITAGGMAPLEFARAIFQHIGLYEEAVLQAWYDLYRTGRSEHFARLRRAAAPDPATTA
jgi:putative intracellular protease/amidase